MVKRNLVKISFKKRSAIEWMVLLIIMLPFTFAGFSEFLHIPDIIRFVIDGFLIVILLEIISKRYLRLHKSYVPLFIFVTCFVCYTCITYIFNYQSIFYYAWGLRNNFRFYVAFFIFIIFLSEEESVTYLKWFDIAFWINAPVSLFQYFVLGYNQDELGGIFGVKQGCNGYTNLFFCLILSKSIINYLNKKEKIGMLILKLATTVIISALAELKFFYLEIIIIVCVAVLVTSFTWRKFVIILSCVSGLLIGIFVLVKLYPEFVDVFTFKMLIESASSDKGYTNVGDLNRLNNFAVISKLILTTIPQKLFGLGLGNCDVSSIEILNTPFYNSHSDLNYNWFSTSFWFLEGGYIGYTLFITFFVICFILSLKLYKSGKARGELCQISIVMSVVCLMSVIYNSALRLEIAYVVYFVLALPFISAKGKTNYNSDNDIRI